MIYNYHSHTARCGHAKGTEEEYILRAISCGIKRMGFSDHIPFRFPDGHDSTFRVPVEQAQEYFSVLRALREKYRGQIELKLGFEMEYYPVYFDTMLANAKAWGCEYLLLGQHYIGNEHPGGFYTGKPSDDPALLTEYVDCVVAGIESGVFTYAAHPDLFNFTGDQDVYLQQMSRICDASLSRSIPLEINFLGLRDNRPYPRQAFWQLVGRKGCPVTFGFDSHTVASAYDGDSLARAEEMVARFGLNYIGEPVLIPLT